MSEFEPLPKIEVIKAIERRYPARIPLVQAKWWGEGLQEQYGNRLSEFDRYPEDAMFAWIHPIEYEEMKLSWSLHKGGAHDSHQVIEDWSQLDEFIEKLPRAAEDKRFEEMEKIAQIAHQKNRYLFIAWWNLFFEKPWSIRGMTNLLMDYYDYPEEIHRLNKALTGVYIDYLERAAALLQPDGFWTSDDLGTQKALFMHADTFREFIKPYYTEVGTYVKQKGMHWWLHSCGNNTAILGDLVEAGLDVFHPVQKHTMDEAVVAKMYAGKITFLVGIDVQHILQEKKPVEVRDEVRTLIDLFDNEQGGMCLAAGNGIVAGTPFENIEAFLDEAVRYGSQHRQQFNAQGR